VWSCAKRFIIAGILDWILTSREAPPTIAALAQELLPAVPPQAVCLVGLVLVSKGHLGAWKQLNDPAESTGLPSLD
jgi:hypothetical protein